MSLAALFTRRDSGRAIAEMIQGKVVEFAKANQSSSAALHGRLMDCTQVKPYRMRYHVTMIETAKIDRSINEGLNREQVLERFIFALIFNFAHNWNNLVRGFKTRHPGERGDRSSVTILQTFMVSSSALRGVRTISATSP
jgi:hypothetical protein